MGTNETQYKDNTKKGKDKMLQYTEQAMVGRVRQREKISIGSTQIKNRTNMSFSLNSVKAFQESMFILYIPFVYTIN